MSRQSRFVLVDYPQHIIIRGNNCGPIFYTHEDYAVYLEMLCDVFFRHECALHAYVLMTNHVHLWLTPYHERGLMDRIIKGKRQRGYRGKFILDVIENQRLSL